MEFEDKVTIPTPEGVELRLTLAGLASRFLAAVIDITIQITLIVALLFALRPHGDDLLLASWFLGVFLVIFGYHVAFETLGSGRTPGKRLNGLRVLAEGGQPVGFLSSSIRTVMRLIDFLPTAYLIGATSILVTARNQRLGDLVAGTIVVRERRSVSAPSAAAPAFVYPVASEPPAWDVTAISADDMAVVRDFLARRRDIAPGARGSLANTLAERLRPKIAGAPPDVRGERLLEGLVAAKSARD